MRFSREDSRPTWPTCAVRCPGAVAPSWPDTRPATSSRPFRQKWYPRVVPRLSLGAKVAPRNRKKPWYYQGFRKERLKTLEPSTFCKASGTTWIRWLTFCLQMRQFCRRILVQRREIMPRNFGLCRWIPGMKPEWTEVAT